MSTDTARDWAILGVSTTILPAADRATAEEAVADAPHLTAVCREPGGEWEPVTNPDEMNRYAFLVDGDMHAGTLKDYATAWVAAKYSGVRISSTVRTWAGATFPVRIVHTGVVEEDWLNYELSVGGETVIARIDGRS